MDLPLPSSSPPSAAHHAPTVKLWVEHVADAEAMRAPRELSLTLREVIRGPREHEEQTIGLHTDRGEIHGCLHPAISPKIRGVLLCVGGAYGELDGPARGLYPALCRELAARGVYGLRIHYRHPNQLGECVLDTMLATDFLHRACQTGVMLLGHSFGGAVVISAGALSNAVSAVIAMSTQTLGADLASRIAPRPLLLIHGTADEILPPVCSEIVYAEAREPKELKLFPGARHALEECREDLLRWLIAWIDQQAGAFLLSGG